jgi:hypothetical protein
MVNGGEGMRDYLFAKNKLIQRMIENGADPEKRAAQLGVDVVEIALGDDGDKLMFGVD